MKDDHANTANVEEVGQKGERHQEGQISNPAEQQQRHHHQKYGNMRVDIGAELGIVQTFDGLADERQKAGAVSDPQDHEDHVQNGFRERSQLLGAFWALLESAAHGFEVGHLRFAANFAQFVLAVDEYVDVVPVQEDQNHGTEESDHQSDTQKRLRNAEYRRACGHDAQVE